MKVRNRTLDSYLYVRIKAFRPGIVDMTEEQLIVNQNAITLQEGNVDLDLLLPDIDWCVISQTLS